MASTTGSLQSRDTPVYGLDDPCPFYRHSQDPGKAGFVLSWPHAENRKRFKVGNSPYERDASAETQAMHSHIVQASHQDLEMHYHLSRSGASAAKPVLEVPLPFNNTVAEADHTELLQYFQHTAARALATFDQDPVEIGKVLTRLATSGDTSLNQAVLHAILAFAALHWHGVHTQAFELKILAFRTLQSASATDTMNTTQATLHVAAGMLLCSFDIHQASCTSGEWTTCLRGVKAVIAAASLDSLPKQDDDLAVLLDWVYYHDVMARFSLRHWTKGFKGRLAGSWSTLSRGLDPSGSPSEPTRAQPSRAPPPAMVLVDLLSEVCDAVSTATSQSRNDDDHANYLKILDWRIRTVTIAATAADTPQTPLLLELFQLAILVYLNRTHPELSPKSRTQQQIDRGFQIIHQQPSCDRQFPVFILGCEARSDDQRAVVLDLIARTEEKGSSASFNYVRVLLQALWVQDDLADGEIGYWDKLSYVISCCRTLPTFV